MIPARSTAAVWFISLSKEFYIKAYIFKAKTSLLLIFPDSLPVRVLCSTLR